MPLSNCRTEHERWVYRMAIQDAIDVLLRLHEVISNEPTLNSFASTYRAAGISESIGPVRALAPREW